MESALVHSYLAAHFRLNTATPSQLPCVFVPSRSSVTPLSTSFYRASSGVRRSVAVAAGATLTANSVPSIVLWSCRHVTQNGLLFLVNNCTNLKSINVWGTRVPAVCFRDMLDLRPDLEIKM